MITFVTVKIILEGRPMVVSSLGDIFNYKVKIEYEWTTVLIIAWLRDLIS